MAIHADALFCISRSVSEETANYMRGRFALNDSSPKIDWFHLGASTPPDTSAPLPESFALREIIGGPARPTVLMVGTLEPRKGHAQTLDAFESLWNQGERATLVIAGRQGWKVDALVERIKNHAEFGKRLFWLAGAKDADIAGLYHHLDGLLVASEAEGFGLPLIEAAQHGMPLFLRDLPVFREVAGEHATYFIAQNGLQLASQLLTWLNQLADKTAQTTRQMHTLTWATSSEQLKALLAKLDLQN
ncbi:glycosyltransferase [Paraburkholderia bryophila]|nr:glycosyltransferase [Paraburkholderia bryophila]